MTGATFRCPCGDPLLDTLEPLLKPTVAAGLAGTLTHNDAVVLANGELACGLLPKLEDAQYAATLSRAAC